MAFAATWYQEMSDLLTPPREDGGMQSYDVPVRVQSFHLLVEAN